MFLFADQHIALYTINTIGKLWFHNYSVLEILGLTFLVLVGVWVGLVFWKGWQDKLLNGLLILAMLFWLPLFINTFGRDVYMLRENFGNFNQDPVLKKIDQFYQLESQQNLSGFISGIIFFISEFEKVATPDSLVKVISSGSQEVYFHYHLYPRYNLTRDFARADYLIFYFPEQEFAYGEDQHLYQVVVGKQGAEPDLKDLGKYEVLKNIGNKISFLKRIRE